jgi:glycosyltransferase involved in cell wall biosynthesis
VTVTPRKNRVQWTFLVPGLVRLSGGNVALFEYANAIARREGEHAVAIAHLPTKEGTLKDVSQIPWFEFHPAVEHVFMTDLDPDALPSADVLFYSVMAVALAAESGADPASRRFLEQIQAPASDAGLPILFVQALGIFPDPIEALALQGAGPKLCVAAWIAKALGEKGLPPSEVTHIPNGIDHRTFRVSRPIAARELQVAMNFNPHPLKQIDAGIEALRRLHREQEVPSILFGHRLPGEPPGQGIRFAYMLDQAAVAESIYNTSAMYLQPSVIEGFGLCALEAMACGCALVTTDNGGSAEYAVDGETALFCGHEVDDMVETLIRLARDEPLRTRIATNGCRFVERFRWEASAERLARLAQDMLAR